MLFFFIYNIFLISYAFVVIPKMLYQRFSCGKYKFSLWQRIGLLISRPRDRQAPLIWIHAVSVGETKAISKLVQEIKAKYPHAEFLLSNTTETGYNQGESSVTFADYHIFLPFDFSWVIRPIVKRYKPALVLISETDLWFNFLDECKKQGAQIVVVNGKISQRSFDRFCKLPLLGKGLLAPIDLFCMQNDVYAERMHAMGVEKSKVRVTGNLKLDQQAHIMPDLERWELLAKLGIETYNQVIVIGSTHHLEEQEILMQLADLLHDIPTIKLILVPRHPERAGEVGKVLDKLGMPYHLYSDSQPEYTRQVTLVNQMGLLQSIYQLATVAIVGGSFIDGVGGHNILEPVRYGVPVVFGPFMYNQPDLRNIVLAERVGMEVPLGNLAHVIRSLLVDSEERKRIGEQGMHLLQSQLGATERTFMMLEPLFYKSGMISLGEKYSL